MLHEEDRSQKLEEFYNALNEVQKQRVEEKLKIMLKENYGTLSGDSLNPIRYRVAADLFQILKG